METINQKRDVYAIVTERIIEQLEKGRLPWKQPWTHAGMPQNLITGKHYKGINLILLNSIGYSQNFFLTRKQLDQIGGAVLPNEKPHIVVFWHWNKKDDNSQPPTQNKGQVREPNNERPILRFYRVFNVSQCIGISEGLIPLINCPNDPIQACEDILGGMPVKPEIIHDFQEAFYDLVEDYINIPQKGCFESSESYYDTLFHEIMHWTGHKDRLRRPQIAKSTHYGSSDYSLEELTAQIGATFLSSMAGIAEKVESNSTAYIQGWLKALRNDRKFILVASSYAQKGVEYILTQKQEGETDDPLRWLKENASFLKKNTKV